MTRQPRCPGNGGFTLLELLVVIALIGLMAVFAIPSVTSLFKVSLNSSAREMGSIVKEAYNASVMTGKVHRLVYNFKDQTYWVEAGPRTVLLDTAESKEREERRKRFATLAQQEKMKEEQAVFQMAKAITRKKVELPRGVEFEDILSEQGNDPISQGTTYTHFFPHGLTEQTTIHLKDNSEHHVTLAITAIGGRTRVYDRYVKNPNEEREEP